MSLDKNSERFYLSRFKELCPEFPDGKVENSEIPDFLVHGLHGVVGIELMDLYRPDQIVITKKKKKKSVPLQAIEKEREDMVKRIKNYYIEMGGCPLHVSFFFSDDFTNEIDPKDEDYKDMAILINTHKPLNGDTSFLEGKNLPFWLDRVSISTREQDRQNFWTAQKFAKIPKVSPIEIQKEINKKEEKFDSYKEKCSFAWLVLMSHVGASLGTHIKFLDDVWNHRYQTLFEQVWIFQNPSSARKLEVVKDNSKQDLF